MILERRATVTKMVEVVVVKVRDFGRETKTAARHLFTVQLLMNM